MVAQALEHFSFFVRKLNGHFADDLKSLPNIAYPDQLICNNFRNIF
jgi:hypothetical protein